MKLQISFFSLFFILSFSLIQASAQPNHSKLLYSDPLDNPNSGTFSRFENNGGSFISGQGWKALSQNSQLFIEVPQNLPAEGTVILDVTNFDPVSQNADTKQQIINLYSQENGSKDIFDTNGSWANIRTGTGYTAGEGMAGFKFLAAPRGIDTRDEKRCIEDATWDLNETYEFKIIWTTDKIYCYFNGSEQAVFNFSGQVEAFRYIFLGTDNVYTAQPGPIYSNLRIYTTDGDPGTTESISFTDITSGAGTGGYSNDGYGHGVSFADVNKDGLIDLFSSNAVRGQLLPDMLYINEGRNQFNEEASARGTRDVGVTHAIVSADFDNDGDLDAFFSDMPSDDGQPEGRNALYRNNGHGYYENITDWGGIVNENNGSRGAAAFDMDNDGDLDLYVANWGAPNEMYLNNGNGKFTRVDRGANGPAEDKSVYGQQGVTAVDFDNDGDIDIYVCRRQESSQAAPNWLFVNDGTGHFTEEAEARHVDYGGRSNGATFVDVDNDGDLDLFVADYHLHGTSAKPQLGVFFNRGDGTFENRTDDFNIYTAAYNTVFGDVDNDGDMDMFLLNNNSKDKSATPELYLNDGHGNFTKLANTGIEVPAEDQRGAGLADIDNDGDIDLYLACKYGHNYMLRNDSQNSNHYIQILCTGPKGDYGGFGSKVSVYEPGHLGDPDYLIGYQEVIPNYGYLCQNMTALHFGLAGNTSCDIRIVKTDGSISEYTEISADQLFSPGGGGGPTTPIKFSNITTSSNTKGYSDNGYAQGVTFADVTEDGRVDLLVSNATRNQKLPDLLYRNLSDDQFSEEGESRGVSDPGLTDAIVSADIDNDGDLDLFYTNIKDDGSGSSGVNNLYRNNGGGYFTDITDSAGISSEENGTRGAVALDIDNDGDIDLYAANWGQPNEMYLNNGNGTFTRVDRGANGPAENTDDFGQQGVAAADFDNDGDVDIYVCRRQDSSQPAPNWLFVNDGSGNFSEEAAARGVDYGGRSHGAVFADVDNDGDLDLFVMNFTLSGTTELPKLGVFFNNGDGTFENRTDAYDIRVSGYTLSFGDIDNDADLDMELIRNDEKETGALPQILLNDGTGHFSEVWGTGFEVPAKDARGAAYGDIDDDGDIDFYIACKDGQNFMLRNDSDVANHFLNVLCYGPKGDYGGVGSRVSVYEQGHLGDENFLIGYQQVTTGYGYMSQNQMALHFGLGERTSCDVRIIRTDGQVFDYSNTLADQTLKMEQQEQILISYQSGNDQHGDTEQTLENPFVVKIADSKGNPQENVQVNFVVVKGNGHMLENQPVLTNASGLASSYLVLGTDIGEYTVEARCAMANNSPVTFTATADSQQIYISYSSGNNQSGYTQRQLKNPFRVQIKDGHENPQENVAVTFVVTQGNGHMLEEQPVLSNASGLASSYLVFGTEAGEYTVEARCNTASNSPVTFTATAESLKVFLSKIDGDNQNGIVGKELNKSLTVQATYSDGPFATNYPVNFKVIKGGGKVKDADSIIVNTDENGRAAVSWVLGTVTGEGQVRAATADSTVIFTSYADHDDPDSLNLLSGANQPCAPAQECAEPFIVKVTDQFGNPVAEHEVLFHVIAGGGNLRGEEQRNVGTDSLGLARVYWTMGDFLGSENQLEISSAFNGDPLVGSPIKISMDVGPAPDGQTSTITASTPVLADGTSTSEITVTVKDSLGNLMPGFTVRITASGTANTLTIPDSISDENGRVGGFLSSTFAENKTITAAIFGAHIHDTVISDSAFVEFLPITHDADSLEYISGNDQRGVVNEPLASPFVVRILDEQHNPLPDFPVQFAVTAGNGNINEHTVETVMTDSSGKAQATLTLGKVSGIANTVQVRAGTAKNSPFVFQAFADPGAADKVIGSGFEQIGVVGQTLPDSSCIRITDAFNNFIPGLDMVCTVLGSNGKINGKTQITLQNGACFSFTLGITAGTDTVQMTSESLPDSMFYFPYTALADKPVRLVKISGDSQKTVISSELPMPLQVRVTDKYENAVANVPVTFSLLDGGEILTTQPVLSDSFGIAKCQVKIGNEWNKEYFFQAKIESGATETFMAMSTSPMVRLVPVSNDTQTVAAGQISNLELKVKAVDAFGNAMENIPINFAIIYGNGLLSEEQPILTDNDGRATAHLQVGPDPDTCRVRVRYDYAHIDFTVIIAYPTSVKQSGAMTIKTIALNQNYPNPFNPTTNITFQLPKAMHVRLVIYNLNGQLISALVDGEMNAGYHTASWNGLDQTGRQMPSGVYYYQLRTKDHVETRKLLLMK